ncbi:daunorubicin resistance protein DrrC [Clostridium botulinum]|uniref:UvrABC system protein A n=1 Tax=Clostridium botulinum TaxID=1491 RepID=A0AAU8YZ37_CLOBO|nr:excinuclease ABC subunit UvrA [Clostridium sporogenes]AVP65108.1 daunorubicin resistance protein DrrC [Clostridium botulinum]MCF4016745.1 excinuclease ABC subunit UvrA [Clostridium sporogenes]
MDKEENINVVGVREKNLKNIDIEIPKKKITVFTGISGSGKSSLVFDTIAAESQRQLNETYSSFIRHRLPHYGQPDVDSIKNLSVAIIINQKRIGGNSRSTVGTITDIAPLLRLLFSRIGKPFVGYSDSLSFNNPTGMCMHCDGLGKVDSINIDKLLDKNKSLNEGAILFPTFKPGGWRLKRYIHSGLFENDKKIKDYNEKELDLLLNKTDIKIETDDPEWPKTSLYEGLIPRIERSFLKKEGGERDKYKKEINKIVTKEICPVCRGSRLNEKILSCKINGKNIADCTKMPINHLIIFMKEIKEQSIQTVLKALISRLEHLEYIGLGYLSLDRETSSLSGGESQRIKMVKQLGSSLTGLTYIFDEPSIGLHPHDIDRINKLLKMLRDKGNTVLIVEHDPDIIKIADYIIDMGPKAGTEGGNIVYKGTPEGLLKSNTLTGKALQYKPHIKLHTRKAKEWLSIKNANLHNLKNINVDIPKGVMTVVTGVAGSGKSTLINGLLPKIYPETIFINQGAIHASKRSNIATYTGIFDSIRNLFAKKNNVKSSLFSFNSEGACPECKGLGVTYTDLAFMDTVISTCEACGGNRFTDKVLNLKFRDKNISEVLQMTVAEAIDFFKEDEIYLVLKKLADVGIDYITLGQPLNTLSGGELQRLKLAAQLDSKGNIYVLDEPTTGLHISDIKKLVAIMNRLVNQGSTLIVIEHNLDVMTQADWIIDLGPEAGENGGRIMFEGEPKDIINNENSITGKYLKRYIL